MVSRVVTLILLATISLPFAGCGGGSGADASSDTEDPGDGGDPADGVDPGSDPDPDEVDPGGGDPDEEPPDPADPFAPDNEARDADCDGLSDQEEFANVYPTDDGQGAATDPDDVDSDKDGLPDGLEVGRTGPVDGSDCEAIVASDLDPNTETSPVASDTDGDGLLDGEEDANANGRVDDGETDPARRDSDGDQVPDGEDTAPSEEDSDGDGIPDGIEDSNGNGVVDEGESDPTKRDTDGDGLEDAEEDINANGVKDATETDPLSPDTDCDGRTDYEELRGTPRSSPLLADTDGDGVTDAVEIGIASPTVPEGCPPIEGDADPSTTTDPTSPDSDGDGLTDGEEDINRNGQTDVGETDPVDSDSDNDGLTDGDESLAGTDPTTPDPENDTTVGVEAICSDENLQVVDFDSGGASLWTFANGPVMAYSPFTVRSTGSGVSVALLHDTSSDIAGFVMDMPLLGAAGNIAEQVAAVEARIQAGTNDEGLSYVSRSSPRIITSHDGFETAVSGRADIGASPSLNAAQVRNAMLRLVSNLPASAFAGMTEAVGDPTDEHVYAYQVLLRNSPESLVIVGAVVDRERFDDLAGDTSLILADLTNGTSLAEFGSPRGKDCDVYIAEGSAVADFVWMADISGSTDDDRGRITEAAELIFDELARNNVDFRMGVVPHTQNRFISAPGGVLRGDGFTTDRAAFVAALEDTSGADGCELGLTAVSDALNVALPRTAPGVVNARRVRQEATIAVVYVSDEYADEVQNDPCAGGDPVCLSGLDDLYNTGDDTVCSADVDQACIDTIAQPFSEELLGLDAVAFAQVISPNATPTNCSGYACPGGQPANEPGRGYIEVVNATGGVSYSPCSATPGDGLRNIIDAVTGAASQFQLTSAPISSTIRVAVVRDGGVTLVPRDRLDGFDYDPAANAIFFRGASFRPDEGDTVVASYRIWEAPVGVCPEGQVFDDALALCVCDIATCNGNCGPNEICDADCGCTCAPDCNGNCGSGEVCDAESCSCTCPLDCGGCPTGTICNPDTCACDCDDCGGACESPRTCASDSCVCECPADCGGACTGAAECNDSLCACLCPDGCSDSCLGQAQCDPTQGCECACPADCGGCPDGTTCNPDTCQCSCPAGCSDQCPGDLQCDPGDGCTCGCPSDCGGCDPGQICDRLSCQCTSAG